MSKRSEIMLQLVLGAILLMFLYLGVERLWISKTQAQLNAQRFAQALQQCQQAKQAPVEK